MIRKILFATDFTSASRRAEELARELATASGAAVVAVHAIEPIDPGGDDDPFASFYQSLRAEAEGRLSDVRGRFRDAGVACRALILVEERWQAILQTAEAESVDLVVMGSRPLLREGRVSVGTTSHKVFLGTRQPLLVVRERPADAAGEAPP